MVLLPAQTLAPRQAGEAWVRVVSAYTIGDLTATTRATARSWKSMRPWVQIFLDEPGTTIQYLIGEQTAHPELHGYQQSSFHTVSHRTYLIMVYTVSLIALKPRLKQRKNWQVVRMFT